MLKHYYLLVFISCCVLLLPVRIAKGGIWFEQPRPLDEPINTQIASEFAPAISGNGQVLMFLSDRQGNPMLYESYRIADAWTQPMPVQRINRLFAGIQTPFLSYDGRILCFAATSNSGRSDLYYAIRQADGWSKPRPFPYDINTPLDEHFPALSPDGRKLLFVREIKPGHSQIWVSERDADDRWQTAKPLPLPINRTGESAPRLLADGQTLLFTSMRNRRRELFAARCGADGLYEQPQLIEMPVPIHDRYAVSPDYDGDKVYLDCKRSEQWDVCVIDLQQTWRPPAAYVQGQIVDKNSGVPLAARIDVHDAHTDARVSESHSSAGNYALFLPAGRAYRVSMSADHFSAYDEWQDLSDQKTFARSRQEVRLFSRIALMLRVKDSHTHQPVHATLHLRDQASMHEDIMPITAEVRSVPLAVGQRYQLRIEAEHHRPATLELDLSGRVYFDTLVQWVRLDPVFAKVHLKPVHLLTDKTIGGQLMFTASTEVLPLPDNGLLMMRQGSAQQAIFWPDSLCLPQSIDLTADQDQQIVLSLMPATKDKVFDLPCTHFPHQSALLTAPVQALLDRIALLFAQYPHLRIAVAAGPDQDLPAYMAQSLMRQRTAAIARYLSAKLSPEQVEEAVQLGAAPGKLVISIF